MAVFSEICVFFYGERRNKDNQFTANNAEDRLPLLYRIDILAKLDTSKSYNITSNHYFFVRWDNHNFYWRVWIVNE